MPTGNIHTYLLIQRFSKYEVGDELAALEVDLDELWRKLMSRVALKFWSDIAERGDKLV